MQHYIATLHNITMVISYKDLPESDSFAGWFGMRQDFCELLLSKLPLLREYGNVSYKFSDALIVEADRADASSFEEIESHSKRRAPQKIVGSLTVIDAPD